MCQSSGNDKEFDTNAVCIKCTYNLCPGLHQLRSWGWGSMQTMKVMKCLSNFTQQANKNSNHSPRNNPNTNPNPNITIRYTLWHLLVEVKNPIPPTRWPTRRLTWGLTNHRHTTDTSAKITDMSGNVLVGSDSLPLPNIINIYCASNYLQSWTQEAMHPVI